MMNNRAKYVAASGVTFVTGLLVGVGAGLLMAPQSGARTRRQLRSLVEDAGERAGCMAIDAREALGRVVERGKRLVA
jgi:gas vesicle protein